jgi:Glycosyl hydrolases family 43
MNLNSFKPGQAWLDTDGNRIQAHGGSMHYEDGWFYWYGEDKSKTTGDGESWLDGVWHNGVLAYKSQDLYNWQRMPHLIPADLEDETSPMHPRRQMDRPHILHNAKTGKYVCFIKVMSSEHEQLTSILVADKFEGPYEFALKDFKPLGMDAGDFDLVWDDEAAQAYYVFEKVHTELIIADLNEDFTDVTGNFSSHFVNGHPPFTREAPAHFKRNGKHYLITSGTTGYLPNRSEAAIADEMHGPWTILGDPHPGDADHISFHSQISCIFKHPLKQDLYIAMADRWKIPVTAEEVRYLEQFFLKMFRDGLQPGPDNPPPPGGMMPVNTSIADYVWLPIRFEGEKPIIDWHEEWRVEDFS